MRIAPANLGPAADSINDAFYGSPGSDAELATQGVSGYAWRGLRDEAGANQAAFDIVPRIRQLAERPLMIVEALGDQLVPWASARCG